MSFESYPAIASRTIAALAASRVKGPTLSRVDPWGATPLRLTRPVVGFNPNTPHIAAGMRIDPPLSLPIAANARPAATDTAEPLLEAPAKYSLFHGLVTSPQSVEGPPNAHS